VRARQTQVVEQTRHLVDHLDSVLRRIVRLVAPAVASAVDGDHAPVLRHASIIPRSRHLSIDSDMA